MAQEGLGQTGQGQQQNLNKGMTDDIGHSGEDSRVGAPKVGLVWLE